MQLPIITLKPGQKSGLHRTQRPTRRVALPCQKCNLQHVLAYFQDTETKSSLSCTR